MSFDLPSLHLAFLDIQPWSIAIIIPVAGLLFAGAIIITTMYFQHRRQEMWHQTARIALEKGQPLPALPDRPADRPAPPGDQAWNDLRGGLVLVATGAGIYLFLGAFLGRGLGYVGAIPGLIGVALLISGFFRLVVGSKHSSDARELPHS